MTTIDYLDSRKSSTRQRPQGLLLTEDFTYNEGEGLYLPTGDEINSDGNNQSFLILSDDNRDPIQIGKERIEKRERMVNGRMRSYHIADKVNISVSWSNLPSRSFSMNPNFASGIEHNLTIVEQVTVEEGERKIIEFTTATNHNFEINSKVEFIDVALDGTQKVIDKTDKTFRVFSDSDSLPDFDENGAPRVKLVTGVAQGPVSEINQDNDPDTPNIELRSFGSRFYKDQQYTTDGGAGGNDLLTWYENHPGSFYVLLAYDKYQDFSNEKYSKLGRYNQAVEVYFSDFSYTVEKRGQLSHDFWNVSFSLEEV
jgi:hypothetical protein